MQFFAVEGEEEEGDPRAELVRRLQEYERYKLTAEKLDEMAERHPEIAHIIDEVFRREIRAGLYQDLERAQEED